MTNIVYKILSYNKHICTWRGIIIETDTLLFEILKNDKTKSNDIINQNPTWLYREIHNKK